LLLGDSRKQVAGLDLKGVSAQWQRTGAAIETLVASPEIKQTFVTLNATLVDLRATLAKLDGQVAATGTDVQATLAQTQVTLQNFSATATTLRNFINAQQGLGEGAGEAFGKLAEAADAVQRLADFLERNPNALLTGKKAPR
jgi:paraquat-inducible protein B